MRLTVPFAPLGGVLQAEVGRQVDDLGPGRQQLAGQGVRDTVRGGEEHHIASGQRLAVRHTERQPVVMAAQVRIHVGNRHARFGARSDDRHFGLWMLRQQTQQFDAGVTRAADDTDLDHNACPLSTSRLESAR
ncbi:hypothetical protein D3C71_1797880 [compost metagenome]